MNLDLMSINFDISIDKCFENLKPHPKFSDCTFDNYIPDENFPSQYYIKSTLIDKINRLNESVNNPKSEKKSIFSFFSKKEEKKIKKILNLYIDGGYGVGKTHLISACYNTSDVKKAFLSFAEMNYFFIYMGVEKCIEEFSKLDLLLIDEFELDDPATTRMIAKFFSAISSNTLIITTSNTLPSDLGKMRFQVDEFEREMGIISGAFKTVIVEGNDYRKKSQKWKRRVIDEKFEEQYQHLTTEIKAKSMAKIEHLMKILEENHPFKYFVIPENIETLFLDGLKPFEGLNDALRFSHFVDHCYYYNTKLFIRSEFSVNELFNQEMINSCFQKKFLRCVSRVDELAFFFKE